MAPEVPNPAAVAANEAAKADVVKLKIGVNAQTTETGAQTAIEAALNTIKDRTELAADVKARFVTAVATFKTKMGEIINDQREELSEPEKTQIMAALDGLLPIFGVKKGGGGITEALGLPSFDEMSKGMLKGFGISAISDIFDMKVFGTSLSELLGLKEGDMIFDWFYGKDEWGTEDEYNTTGINSRFRKAVAGKLKIEDRSVLGDLDLDKIQDKISASQKAGWKPSAFFSSIKFEKAKTYFAAHKEDYFGIGKEDKPDEAKKEAFREKLMTEIYKDINEAEIKLDAKEVEGSSKEAKLSSDGATLTLQDGFAGKYKNSDPQALTKIKTIKLESATIPENLDLSALTNAETIDLSGYKPLEGDTVGKYYHRLKPLFEGINIPGKPITINITKYLDVTQPLTHSGRSFDNITKATVTPTSITINRKTPATT